MLTWFRKATAAFFGAGLPAIGAATLPGTPGDAAITSQEAVTALSLAIVAALAVFFTPANTPREGGE